MSALELPTLALRLRPGDRLSHVTAARRYGIPLPLHADPRIHVTSSLSAAQLRRAGYAGHRDDGAGHRLLAGVPVSTPEQTFIELGRHLDEAALVAAGDCLVHLPRFGAPDRPWTTIERLAEACAAHRWGITNARSALALVRPGVESPMETALRLLLTRAGLPEPVCGFELRDGGRRIGWFDLAWPDRRVLGEYDGDDHRLSTAQYDKDILRFDLAAAAGWAVVRVRASGMRRDQRSATIERFRRALSLGAKTPAGYA